MPWVKLVVGFQVRIDLRGLRRLPGARCRNPSAYLPFTPIVNMDINN